MQLFISYAHVDTAIVRESIVEILRAAGHDPWFDHELVPGHPWKDQLLDAIKRSEALVYALTPDSVASDYCQWEFKKAVELGKPIIPILLRPTALPDNLSNIQFVDFTGGATGLAVAKLSSGLSQITVQVPSENVRYISENPRDEPARITQTQPVTIPKAVSKSKPESTPTRPSTSPLSSRALLAALMVVAIGIIGYVLVVLLPDTGSQPDVPRIDLPSDVEGSLRDAYDALQNGQFEDAVDLAEQALNEGQDQIETYLLLCEAYNQLGDHDSAIEKCTIALEMKSDQPLAYTMLCWAYAINYDIDEAINSCNRAIEFDAQNPVNYLYRADVLTSAGEYQDAYEDYGRALDLSPDYASAIYGRCILDNLIGEYEQALDDCQRAIDFLPDHAEAFRGLCEAHNQLGDFEAGLENCNRALEIDPDLTSAHVNRCWALNGMGDYQAAIEACTLAIELGEEGVNVYETRGWAFYSLGDLDSADTDFLVALRIDPNNGDALLGAGAVYFDWEEPELAREYYCRYLDATGEDNETVLERIEHLGGCGG